MSKITYTPHELDVLRGLNKGMCITHIAEELGKDRRNTATVAHRICARLGINPDHLLGRHFDHKMLKKALEPSLESPHGSD